MSAKLTPWFPPETKPVRIGTYNASEGRNPGILRYWNGLHWSKWYGPYDPEDTKNRARHQKENPLLRIYWRGLPAEPKVTA